MSLALKKNQFVFRKGLLCSGIFCTLGMIHSDRGRKTPKLHSDFYIKDSKVVPDINSCPFKHFLNLKFFVLASPKIFFFFFNEIRDKYLDIYNEKCEGTFLLYKILCLGLCLKHPKAIAGDFSFQLYAVKFAEISRHHLYKKD